MGCVLTGTVGLYTTLRTWYYGGDSRFDGVRGNPRRMARAFVLQGIWVTVCTLPVVAMNTVPGEAVVNPGWAGASTDPEWLLGMAWFWLGLWAFVRGQVLELIADWQLARWRWERDHGEHGEVFCNRGLWSKR